MNIVNNNLHIFVAVAEKKNITKAAQSLYISQPAVSKAITLLEEELKTTLFYRDKRAGMVLTSAGEEVLRLTRKILSLENQLYQSTYENNELLAGKLTIACLPFITSHLLPQVLMHFAQKYPKVTISLLEGTPSEIEEAVQSHRADIGISASPFGNLETNLLYTDKMVAIKKTPFPTPFFDIMGREEELIFNKASQETTIQTLARQGIFLERCFQVAEPESVVRLIEVSDKIGIISEFALAKLHHQLYSVPVHPLITIDVAMIVTSFAELTPAAKIFCRHLK